MQKGSRHTPETRQRISEKMKGPRPKTIERDLKVLERLKECMVWEYALAAECSDSIAAIRLRRLVDLGLAERWRGRGEISYKYGLRLPGSGATNETSKREKGAR